LVAEENDVELEEAKATARGSLAGRTLPPSAAPPALPARFRPSAVSGAAAASPDEGEGGGGGGRPRHLLALGDGDEHAAAAGGAAAAAIGRRTRASYAVPAAGFSDADPYAGRSHARLPSGAESQLHPGAALAVAASAAPARAPARSSLHVAAASAGMRINTAAFLRPPSTGRGSGGAAEVLEDTS